MSVESPNGDSLSPDQLERILRHSSNPYARACAWVLLDRKLDEPDLEELEAELQSLKERRETTR